MNIKIRFHKKLRARSQAKLKQSKLLCKVKTWLKSRPLKRRLKRACNILAKRCLKQEEALLIHMQEVPAAIALLSQEVMDSMQTNSSSNKANSSVSKGEKAQMTLKK